MDGLVKELDERGVSLIETIFAVSILVILGSAAMFHGSSVYRNALLNYETVMLASDMKLIRQMSRTATYDTQNFPAMEKSPFYVELVMYSGSYHLRRPGGYGKIFRKHNFSPDIGATPTIIDYLSFYPDGNTRFRRMGNVLLYWRAKGKVSRKVIVDTAGRIRIDRRGP